MSLIGDTSRELQPVDFRRMNVGRRYWNVALERIPEQASYRAALEKFIGRLKPAIEGGYGLVFYGPYRKGKTGASILLMKEVVSRGGTAYFLRADEVAGVTVEKTMFDEDQTVENRMKAVDLLVIDDLGTEATREAGAGMLERLIRWRYDSRKSLVVTTNASSEQLERKLTPGTLLVMKSVLSRVHVDGTTWLQEEVDDVTTFFGGESERRS